MIPAWTIPLLIRAIGLLIKHRHEAKARKQALAALKAEVPQMGGLADVLGWVAKAGFLKGYRTKIGAACFVASALFSALADPSVTAAWPTVTSVAHALGPVGVYLGIIGARFAQDK